MTIGTVLIIAGAGAIVYEVFPSTPKAPSAATGFSFYSTDDGATWFSDSVMKIPPFEVNGKEAVRAHVFRSGGSGAPWVQYLEKYSEKAKTELKLIRSGSPGSVVTGDGLMAGPLVKRPQDSKWVKRSDPSAREIVAPKSPSGDGSKAIEEVIAN